MKGLNGSIGIDIRKNSRKRAKTRTEYFWGKCRKILFLDESFYLIGIFYFFKIFEDVDEHF